MKRRNEKKKRKEKKKNYYYLKKNSSMINIIYFKLCSLLRRRAFVVVVWVLILVGIKFNFWYIYLQLCTLQIIYIVIFLLHIILYYNYFSYGGKKNTWTSLSVKINFEKRAARVETSRGIDTSHSIFIIVFILSSLF